MTFICIGSKAPCGKEQRTPRCSKSCESGYSVDFDKDKHFGSSAYSVSVEVEKIQTEIMTNGPVEGTMTVYQDFLAYKSGNSNTNLMYLASVTMSPCKA